MDSSELAFEGQNYPWCSLDLKREPLSLHWRDPRSGQPFGNIEALRQWGEAQRQRLLFAANAGIYDQAVRTAGPVRGKRQDRGAVESFPRQPASGNFSLLPNGVFAIYPDGHAAVRTSAAFKADGKPADWATQSGPMLVIDGSSTTSSSTIPASLKWRSGVCVKTPYRSDLRGERGAREFPYVWAAVPRQAGLPRCPVPGRQHLAVLHRRHGLRGCSDLHGQALRGHLCGVCQAMTTHTATSFRWRIRASCCLPWLILLIGCVGDWLVAARRQPRPASMASAAVRPERQCHDQPRCTWHGHPRRKEPYRHQLRAWLCARAGTLLRRWT